MKYFIIKTVIFCLPVFIIFAVPLPILFFTGENYKSIDKIISSNEEYLIGYAYNEKNYRYLKHQELKNKKALDVIALGSSRVLQFRDKMFTGTFYNAGYTISSISDFTPFIESNLTSREPKVLLIALDQWMFNANWDDLSSYNSKNSVWSAPYNKNASVKTLFNVWIDLFKGKYDFQVVLSEGESSIQKVGLNAFVNNKGFRKDGSIFYGNQIYKLLFKDSTANDFDYLDTYSRIKEGNRRFQHGSKISEKSIKVLEDFLLLCKSKNIYVIAILPPFADKVNLKIRQLGKYTYMDSIYYRSNQIFKKYDFEIWDMTSLSKYNSNDNETIDGFHGSEVSYIKILIYMAENGSKINEYVSLHKLKKDLMNKENNYSVYKY